MSETIANWAVSGAMFTLMFGMGLTLSIDDFRRIARAPRATIIGTVLQLIVMPTVALAIARAFELPPLLAVGLVLIGACPGGMFSNMYVHLARGHTALSITLTATATLVTLFTLPLWVRLALTLTPGGSGGIEMPILQTALQLGMLTVLPVLIGMLARHARPSIAAWERRLSTGSAVVIVFGVVRQAAARPEPPTAELIQSVLPVACFSLAAIAVGIVIPALLGLRARDTVTVAVELIVKNTLLGIVLVSGSLDFEAMVPILIFAGMQTPGGIAILVGWRLLANRGYFREGPIAEAAILQSR